MIEASESFVATVESSAELSGSPVPNLANGAADGAANGVTGPGTEQESSAARGPVVRPSEAALAEIRRLRDKRGADDLILRVGVKGGGCAGLTYTLTFETRVTEKDHVFDFEGVRVVVDRKSALFVRGMVLDYSDALIGGGFRFENPNARRSCSCGSSFSA